MSKVFFVLLLSVSLRADVIFDSFVGTVTYLASTNATLSNGVYNTTVGSTIYGTISFDPFVAGTTTLIAPPEAYVPMTFTIGNPPIFSTLGGNGLVQQPFSGTLFLLDSYSLVDGVTSVGLGLDYANSNSGLLSFYQNLSPLLSSDGAVTTYSYPTPIVPTPTYPLPITNPGVLLDTLQFSIDSISPISTGSPAPPTDPTPPSSGPGPSSAPEPATVAMVALPILLGGLLRKFVKFL